MPYKNPEDRKAWKKRNRGKQFAYSRKWKRENPEKVKAQHKQSVERRKQRNLAAGLTADGKVPYVKLSEEELRRRKNEAQRKRDRERYGTQEYRDKFNAMRLARRKAANPTLGTIREKLIQNMRTRILDALMRRESRANLEHVIGCSIAYLKSHLEFQFIHPMSWDNHGSIWHIDHIVPCSYHDLMKPEEIKRCWHFQNLRPYWADKNVQENNRRGYMTPLLGV